MTTICVIGGGAAGISAAHRLLHEGHEVLLIEAQDRLGGNCMPVSVRGDDGRQWTVDAGVSDFNRVTFGGFAALLDELGLDTAPIGTDTSCASVTGHTVASSSRGRHQLAACFDGGDIEHELLRFRERAPEVLDDERFAGWSLGRYLDHIGASPALRDACLLPRAGGAFPMPNRRAEHMPVRPLIEFFRMHGIVGAAPDRHCVVGGMHCWPAAFARWFEARGGGLLLATRVTGVRRTPRGIDVRAVDRDGRPRAVKAEHVVFCQHASNTLRMLADASALELHTLLQFPRQRARVVVHQDTSVVGDDPARFGAFNYVVATGELPAVRPTITFFPNRLMGLPAHAPDVFVSMNPHREPRPELVITERSFVHPIADERTAAAALDLQLLQGVSNTWFAGSHLQSPFVHESAVQSGRRTAELLLSDCRAVRAIA